MSAPTLAGRSGVRACLRATLLALAALVPADAASAGPVPRDFYGVSGNDVFVDPAVKASDQLAAMSAGGMGRVRFDAEWARVEPNPPDAQTGAHDYRWTYYDSRVESLSRQGLRWHPVLAYNTSWSGTVPGDLFSAPARVSDYAAYAASLARRYGRGGSFWSEHPELTPAPVTSYEIWNEPNLQFFWHPQDQAPERYADLYAAARTAIRGVDSAARVVTGGLTVSNTGVTPEGDWLRRMYAHRPDLAGAVDAVGYHPYMPSIEQVYQRLGAFRRTLDRAGGTGVPLELTELGWTTVHTAEADRAAYLEKLARELPRSDCAVERFIPYSWVTGEYDPSNPEHWFGIYNKDATPKQSGAAYTGAARLMEGLESTPPPDSPTHICRTLSRYGSEIAETPGLAGYWRLGESLGGVAQDERLGRDGKYVGGPALRRVGAIVGDADTAAGFASGVNDYADLGDLSVGESGEFSAEAWVKTTGSNTNRWLVGEGSTASNSPIWGLVQEGAVARAFYRVDGGASTNLLGRRPINDGAWHHLALTVKKGGSLSLYVDGALDGSASIPSGSITLNTSTVGILRRAALGSEYAGDADEVALYRSELTPATVKARFEQGSPPRAPGSLSATGGEGAVSLDWDDNSEADLAGYDVYRATSQGGPYSKLNASRLADSNYLDTGVSNGTAYHYVVKAVDRGGTESAASPEVSATPVDRSAPQTTLAPSGPSGRTNSTSAAFSYFSEAGASFECKLDRPGNPGVWGSCPASGQSYGDLTTEGDYTFSVRATDQAGNTDATPETRTWTVDTKDPDTTITSGPPATTTSSSAAFGFETTEPGGTFECKLDSSVWSPCSSPKSYENVAAGAHTFSVRATDAAGNTDTTAATRAWARMQPAIVQPVRSFLPTPSTTTAPANGPTAAAISAALKRDLAPAQRSIKRVGLRRLPARRGFVLRGIDTLSAGRLSVEITSTRISRGHSTSRRRAVVAKGSRLVSQAGSYRLTVKPTRSGRRLLPGASRFVGVLTLRFAPHSGGAIKRSGSVRLRRGR